MFSQVDVSIVEQPARDSIRFRYKSDERFSGSIKGVNSTTITPIFPTIRIHTFQYNGPVLVIASCVTTDIPYTAHPNKLVGDDCEKDVCIKTVVSDSSSPIEIRYRNLGIERTKCDEIIKNLDQRERYNTDRFFGTDFGHRNNNAVINTHMVRICFQVFLTEETNLPITAIALINIVSEPIQNKLTIPPDLVIKEISDTKSTVHGGKKIMIFCNKVTKKDIRIRFYQEDIFFDEWVDVESTIVHRQYAIAFYTPKYKFLDIDVPAYVYIQLVRPSDNNRSEPVSFQYIPDVSNVLGKMKKRKIEESHELFQFLKAFRGKQTDKTSANISPKVELKPNSNLDSDTADIEQQLIYEQASVASSLYNNQLQTIHSQHEMEKIDQSPTYSQLSQFSHNRTCCNHFQQVNCTRQNQEICSVNSTQPQPSCSSNLTQYSQINNDSHHVQFANQNQQHQLNHNQRQPSCSHHSQYTHSQPNSQMNQISHYQPQASCTTHLRQVYQVSNNRPQSLYINQLQQADRSQQNFQIHTIYSNSDMSLNSNQLPQANDSPSNYLSQWNLNGGISLSETNIMNREFEVGANPILTPSYDNTELLNNTDQEIDESELLLEVDFEVFDP